MGDDLPEKLYMAWRSALLSSQPDLPSWGNVRDPDVRAAWEAAATKARGHVQEQCALQLRSEVHERGALDAIALVTKQWRRTS